MTMSRPLPADGDAALDATLDAATVLDAAAGCYLRLGVAKTTAVDIARAAGISRATLYRRYGSHESIFLAVLERESAAMAAESQEHLRGIADPAERVVEGMMFSISQIGSRPVHAAIFTGESAAWAAGQAIRMQALRRIGEAAVRPLLGPAGLTENEHVADLVDWIIRILLSYAAVPGPAGMEPAAIRRQLTTWFLPGFERLLHG
jgi:AcrR family transcriptional regulator